jgi:C_GCAxxG_C_C family probable redox protein
MTKEKSREDLLNEIEEKAGDYEVLWESCAQGTLAALQEAFHLEDENALKAATAMPGIALRGETCGAVMGAIMVLGLAFGRREPADEKAVQVTMSVSRKLCRRFEEVYGSCNCRDIQQKIFGRTFDVMKQADLDAFNEADQGQKCRKVAGKAARIAAELILGPVK